MLIQTPFRFLSRPLLLGLMVCGSGGLAQASPVPNLTFNINAKISAVGGGTPAQTMNARVLLHGNRTRVETTYAGQNSVTLIAPPYIYRLLPEAKAGVRWKLNPASNQGAGALGINPQELIRSPGKIRALLVQNGARRTGSTTLNGVSVDVYQISNPKGDFSSAKAWIRQSDALPLRLEAAGRGLQVSALWSNYARPKDLSAALFRAPQNYRIRDARSAPPMAMF